MLNRRIQAEVPHAATGFCSERRGTRELLESLNRTKHPLAGALSLQNNFASGVAVGKYVAGSQCSKKIHLSCSDKTSGRARDNLRLYFASRARIVFNMLSKRPQSNAIIRSA